MAYNITLALGLFVLAPCANLCAQGIYHHRSTFQGDVNSSAGELLRGMGAAARDQAEAYRAFWSAEEQRLLLDYRRYQIRSEIAASEAAARLQKLERRRVKLAKQAMAQDRAAIQLQRDVQAGCHRWPRLIRERQSDPSVRLIQSLLVDWNASCGGQAEVWVRRAVATEAAILRDKIVSDASLPFWDRMDASRTLKLVMRLSAIDGSSGDSDLLTATH